MSETERRIQELEDMLQELLYGSGAPSYQAPSPEEIRRRAVSTVSPQYDAQIKALKDMITGATQRTERDKTTAGQLYNALAGSYEAEVPEAQASTQRYTQESKNIFDELSANVDKTYDQITAEQAELYKQLGIQAAAPEILGQQAEQEAFFQQLAQQQGAAAQQRNKSFGEADVEYFRQGAPIARQEGINVQTDLMSRLEDYVRQQNVQISGLESQKQASINEMMNQLEEGAARAQSDAEAQAWNRQKDIANLLLELARLRQEQAESQAKISSQGGGAAPTKGIRRGQEIINGFVQSGTISNKSSAKISQAIDDAIAQAGRMGGGYDPQQLAYLLRHSPEFNYLTPSERQVAVYAILGTYGMY